MTAPLTERQAHAVVEATGAKLVDGNDGQWRAIDAGLTVSAWGATPADVAAMIRTKAAGDLEWKGRAFDRAKREFDEATRLHRDIEAAATRHAKQGGAQ